MSTTDDSTLRKIAKRYNGAANIGQWDIPEEDVAKFIEQLLLMNKTKTIQMLPNNKRHIAIAETDMQEFIDSFIEKLKGSTDFDEEDWLRLPPNLNKNDFNYDYQLQKLSFLKNLYSNELKLVERLKSSLKSQTQELDNWEKYLDNFKKIYEQELQNNDNIKIHKRENVRFLDNIDTEDVQVFELLNSFEKNADELLLKTQDLSKVSWLLDEINDVL